VDRSYVIVNLKSDDRPLRTIWRIADRDVRPRAPGSFNAASSGPPPLLHRGGARGLCRATDAAALRALRDAARGARCHDGRAAAAACGCRRIAAFYAAVERRGRRHLELRHEPAHPARSYQRRRHRRVDHHLHFGQECGLKTPRASLFAGAFARRGPERLLLTCALVE